ncbi:phytanoyl-CoA dioxygenase family protein [Streptomyces sp. NPDC001142]
MSASRSVLSAAELNQLDRDGYLVIPDVLTTRECEDLSDDMDRAWQQYNLAETTDTEDGVCFVRNALCYCARLQECLLDPRVLQAARAVVGDRLVLNLVNGRSPGPGAAGQPLHVLNRRRGAPFDKCNAIWCLDDFTIESGATRVLPGSHLDDRAALARMGDPMEPHPDEIIVEAPRGAVIFHNSHVIHSGRPNRSNRWRRSIHAAYTRPDVKPHYDWWALPEEITRQLSPMTMALLGREGTALTVTG